MPAEANAPPYSPKFFARHGQQALASARRVVPLILEVYQPASVVDVGCATGAFLVAFQEHGVSDVLGVDGEYLPTDRLLIPPERFVARDLSAPLDVDRTFDLAVCLEVGEHLPAAASSSLVESLVRLAPVVVFSAAVPAQGGIGHVNEQWPPYWIERFARHGYRPVDCLRPRLWEDREVAWYYAQNSFLFVSEEAFESHPSLARARDRYECLPATIVHPTLYEARAKKFADPTSHSLPTLARATTRVAMRSLRAGLRRFSGARP